MKRRKQIITIGMALLVFGVNAQLKVDPNGHISIGTNTTHPDFTAYVKGNMVMTTFPQSNYDKFEFKVGNGAPGAEFGSIKGIVAVWNTWSKWNEVQARKFQKISDIKYKQDILPIESALEKILKLKSYSYNFRTTITSVPLNSNKPL